MSYLAVARDAWDGTLPPRYVRSHDDLWRHLFDRATEAELRPGMAVLDAGSGRRPAVVAARRPAGIHYAGLDISADELALAPEGSYDETHVADLAEIVPELTARFDLVLNLFVLEHVSSLAAAVDNMRAYLRPGGRLVAQLAGGRSLPGLLNRAIPHATAARLVTRFGYGRYSLDTVFPAHYDRCHWSGLTKVFGDWNEVAIVPQYTGAQYFSFARPVLAAYMLFEEATARRDLRDCASWYLVTATNPARETGEAPPERGLS
jgi:SAM-dependent methyltransferase